MTASSTACIHVQLYIRRHVQTKVVNLYNTPLHGFTLLCVPLFILCITLINFPANFLFQTPSHIYFGTVSNTFIFNSIKHTYMVSFFIVIFPYLLHCKQIVLNTVTLYVGLTLISSVYFRVLFHVNHVLQKINLFLLWHNYLCPLFNWYFYFPAAFHFISSSYLASAFHLSALRYIHCLPYFTNVWNICNLDSTNSLVNHLILIYSCSSQNSCILCGT